MTKIKLLIFSDSHGDVGTMIDITEKEQPDELIHLGDHWNDAETLSFAFPDIPIAMVPGNCDPCWGKKDKLILKREGKTILLAHGHQWRVKSTSALAIEIAREEDTDVLLFGHTHQALCHRDQEMWVMNPGTVGGRWAPASYGIIEIGESGLECRLVFL